MTPSQQLAGCLERRLHPHNLSRPCDGRVSGWAAQGGGGAPVPGGIERCGDVAPRDTAGGGAQKAGLRAGLDGLEGLFQPRWCLGSVPWVLLHGHRPMCLGKETQSAASEQGGQSSGSKLLQTPPCLRQQPPAAPALPRLIQVKPRLQNASLKEILREGTWNEKSAAGLGFVHTQTKTVFFLVGFLNSKHRFVQEKPKPWCRDCGASPAVRAGLLRSEPR